MLVFNEFDFCNAAQKSEDGSLNASKSYFPITYALNDKVFKYDKI